MEFKAKRTGARVFPRMEPLVVIAITGILAVLLLPKWARAQSKIFLIRSIKNVLLFGVMSSISRKSTKQIRHKKLSR